MQGQLIARLIADKIRDPTTYYVALIVGTLINGYGQLLVPWFRSDADPFALFAAEWQARPGLTLFSIFLAYAFPFCVGIYSAVAARYKNRRLESIADFPERKPDPVFLATRSGQLVELGASNKRLFEKYNVDCAQQILGDETWARIAANDDAVTPTKIYFEAEDAEYLVTYVPTENEQINVYLTRLPG